MRVVGGLGIDLDRVGQLPAYPAKQALAAFICVKGLLVVCLRVLPVPADHPGAVGFAIGELVHAAAHTEIGAPQVSIDDQAARRGQGQSGATDEQAFGEPVAGDIIGIVDNVIALIVPVTRDAVNAFTVGIFRIEDGMTAALAEGFACCQVHAIACVISISGLAALN